MLRNGFRAWLTAIVSGAFALGCGHGNSDRPFPPDPLLLSKHPATGKADAPAPEQTAFTAPAPPPAPSSVAIERKPASDQTVAITPVSHVLAPKFEAPLYAHASDYSWLEGVLERRVSGGLYLRYCDPSTEDRWGGKVGLEFDTQLSHLPDGQRLHVEGEMIPETDDAPRTNWNPYPQYRVRSLRTIDDSNR
jgi:hypothetical protein